MYPQAYALASVLDELYGPIGSLSISPVDRVVIPRSVHVQLYGLRLVDEVTGVLRACIDPYMLFQPGHYIACALSVQCAPYHRCMGHLFSRSVYIYKVS